MFYDDDGKLYFYWGSGNKTPIYGVELDPDTMEPIGEKKELIWTKPDQYGYERFGESHVSPWTEEERERKFRYMAKHRGIDERKLSEYEKDVLKKRWGNGTYLEGAWMTKYNNLYYLQYASTGTEFNIYGDGVYISPSPLGPFSLAENNPYSYVPNGFMTGAGHGSTIQKGNGSWWHAATLRISVNQKFERRVGLWRAGFDQDGELFCDQRYATWPIAVDELNERDPFVDPEWFLLNYRCKVVASSWQKGYEPEKAVDENCMTHWRAETNKSDEWIKVDLGSVMDVRAIQLNFADGGWIEPLPKNVGIDDDKERYIYEHELSLGWKLEGSEDGEKYWEIEDKSNTQKNHPHDLIIRAEGISVRYIRLSSIQMPFGQSACVSGMRVFGIGKGEKPKVPEFEVNQIAPMDMDVRIQGAGAEGYVILWGNSPEKLYHSYMSYQTDNEIGGLVAGKEYFVRVDAFNKAGITKGKVKKLLG